MEAAEMISGILHPVPVSVVSSVLATAMVWRAGVTRWVVVALGMILVPLTVMYLWRGKEFFRARENRKTIYLIGILLAVSYTSASHLFSAPSPVPMISVSVPVAGAVFAGLNLRMKISVHTGVMSGAATILTGLEPIAGLSFLLVPLVGWSRIKLDRHEPLQVLAGAVITPAVFLGIHLLGSS